MVPRILVWATEWMDDVAFAAVETQNEEHSQGLVQSLLGMY